MVLEKVETWIFWVVAEAPMKDRQFESFGSQPARVQKKQISNDHHHLAFPHKFAATYLSLLLPNPNYHDPNTSIGKSGSSHQSLPHHAQSWSQGNPAVAVPSASACQESSHFLKPADASKHATDHLQRPFSYPRDTPMYASQQNIDSHFTIVSSIFGLHRRRGTQPWGGHCPRRGSACSSG